MSSLPAPYTEAPNVSEEEQDAWLAAITAFVTNLVICNLSSETIPSELFKPFGEPQHQPLLYYHACAALLTATRDNTEAGEHISLISALFALLKEEGLKRDGPGGQGTYGNGVVFPALRAALSDIPAPPGFTYNSVNFVLEKGSETSQDLGLLGEYARAHQGLLRLWSLVGRLEASGTLATGAYTMLFHSPSLLLQAVEEPIQRGIWETLWAALLGLEEDDLLSRGVWASEGQKEFKEASRKIGQDQRAPVLWQARFAAIAAELDK